MKIFKKRIILILSSLVVIVVLAFTGMYYYQVTRFNGHIAINHIQVGGLTADQAINKLKSTVLKNVVYVGGKQIVDGNDTKMEFTVNDLSDVKRLLRKQRTFFPSSKAINFYLNPSKVDSYQTQTIKQKLEDKLKLINKSLETPIDASVRMLNGKIIVSKSISGQQYDIAGLLKEYEQQEYKYNSEIHLKPLYVQPIKANDPIIEQEKKMLEELAQRTVNYKVQNKVYPFKGSDIIKNAYVSKNSTVQKIIDMDAIKKKLNEINQTQSTLHKNYTFKTNSGSIISVKGQSYGWALHVNAESKRIQDAFEKRMKSILAYNVYGVGWNINGVGYHTTTNHSIGDSYVELSIKDQRIWVYKNGELKVTTSVVTGTHIYKEDTPKGVWYIEYKQSPSILKGSEVGNANYSVKVTYWAPFTLSGDGFHDASWRKNWSSDAYIKYGSGGCVNTPPNIMKSVYDNLTQYEPVVIY